MLTATSMSQLAVPKEGVTIAFSPSGVRAPQRAQQASASRPATQEEPFWEEATAFTRRHALQRNVEVEVCSGPGSTYCDLFEGLVAETYLGLRSHQRARASSWRSRQALPIEPKRCSGSV